jgi:hypothetical protein
VAEDLNPAGARGTSGWVVWAALAGVLLTVVGVFQIVQGVGALLTDQRFLLRDTEPMLGVSTTVWGWVHVIMGLVVVGAGFLVFAGKVWARAVGVAVAVASGLLGLSLLDGHPIWAAAVVVADLVVILALSVHGSEIKAG